MTHTEHEISATRREVQTRAIDGRQAHVVRLTRAYETSVEDLWSACTDAERIPRWLLPISGELRAGGHYQLEGNAGGTITRCDPPRHLAASWEYGGSVSWIELTLTPRSPGVTELVLEHISHVEDDEKWATFGPGAVGVVGSSCSKRSRTISPAAPRLITTTPTNGWPAKLGASS